MFEPEGDGVSSLSIDMPIFEEPPVAWKSVFFIIALGDKNSC